jgi:hypothetical protein
VAEAFTCSAVDRIDAGDVEAAGGECGGVAEAFTCSAVDRIEPGAVGDGLLGGAADDAPVLAASGVAPALHPAKASTVTPTNPAPPPRTARRLISACSDMVVSPYRWRFAALDRAP